MKWRAETRKRAWRRSASAAAWALQWRSNGNRIRHCEERSDEAIQRTQGALRYLDCFAPLAMTSGFEPSAGLLEPASQKSLGRKHGESCGSHRRHARHRRGRLEGAE